MRKRRQMYSDPSECRMNTIRIVRRHQSARMSVWGGASMSEVSLSSAWGGATRRPLIEAYQADHFAAILQDKDVPRLNKGCGCQKHQGSMIKGA